MAVSAAVFEAPALAAVIVVAPLALTGNDVMGKVASAVPAATVTLAGTVALEVTELVSVTTVPPAGAARFSATVPVAPNPPTTLVWLSVRESSSV